MADPNADQRIERMTRARQAPEGRPAPPKKPAKKAKAAKKVSRTDSKKAAEVKVKASELRAKGAKGDAGALDALKLIQKRYAKWNKAKASKTDTGKQCGEQLKAAEAAFTNAIEAPLEVGKVDTLAYKNKLETVEQRWQEWSEVKGGNIEEKKNARDEVKAAFAALNEAIEASQQLAIPGIG